MEIAGLPGKVARFFFCSPKADVRDINRNLVGQAVLRTEIRVNANGANYAKKKVRPYCGYAGGCRPPVFGAGLGRDRDA